MSKGSDGIIITIGRTFGSGAREIGRKVAEELKIPFYDKEILEIEAKEYQGEFFTEDLREFDEKKPSIFLYSMALNPYAGDEKPWNLIIEDIQSKAIKSIADQGSCVIIGRRADKILRNEYDTLNVFISASVEERAARVSKRDGLSDKDSRKKIFKADKTRRSYYNSYGEGDWGEASNYNLCIDSGDLGIDNSVALIIQYLKLKGKYKTG